MMMRRSMRGFKLRGKLVKIQKWITIKLRRRRRRRSLLSLEQSSHRKKNVSPITKVLSLARQLKHHCLRPLFQCANPRGYVPLEHDAETFGSDKIRSGSGCGVPKGHMAVYVGESQDETQRYLVPVMYFNHPLFGELLKEAERVFGFDHPGRITIPCGPSEFEKVQMRIASGTGKEDSLQRRRINHVGQYYW